MANNIHILSTANLNSAVLRHAAASGVEIDVMNFIQVTDITDKPEITKRLIDLYEEKIAAIFTSANAVYAVCETPFFKRPDWNIYCIEPATKKAVLDYFEGSAIKGVAENAPDLANYIVGSKRVKEAVFFCGAQRMETLPEILQNAGIILNEVVVYETVETPKFVENQYDAVLFFSPSAVNSYFNLNIPGPETVLFAIGNTTAQAIKENTENKIIVCSLPAKEILVNEAIGYFEKIKGK